MIRKPIGLFQYNMKTKINIKRGYSMKELGLYIHIPFCKQKCYYCDFVSYAKNEKFFERYIEALLEEMNNFFDNNDIEIKTIYIGGGTPSIIDAKYIEKIMNFFKEKDLLKKTKEITIEVNPGTVDEEKIKCYKKAGINRLSIGLQSTDDNMLKKIGRIHCYKDFLNTYKFAKEAGFDNINVDIMIGLPKQKISDVKNTLEKIINLEPEPPKHISVYSLIVEENTPIEKMINDGTLELPDEENERNMYWYVKNFLELNGYNHYEISNFAKDGYESIHNSDCWKQKEYIGFGVAAHSFIDDVRFGNTSNLDEYLRNCENKDFENNRIIDEIEKDLFSKEQEFMLVGLRMIDGVSIQEFKNKFGENPIFVFKSELSKLVEDGLLMVDFDRIKLTNRGLDLANLVWEEFV